MTINWIVIIQVSETTLIESTNGIDNGIPKEKKDRYTNLFLIRFFIDF